MRAVALLLCFLPGAVMAAKAEIPPNVTMSGKYITAIDFGFAVEREADFARLKFCVAENVSFDPVTLSDSAGSFFGPATGTYYQNSNSQTVQGGSVFKYVDDSAKALIANGTADGGSAALGFTRDVLRFELKGATLPDRVELKFQRIVRAQQSTGSVANPGFVPVGVWWGSKWKKVYDALDGLSGQIKGCMTQPVPSAPVASQGSPVPR